MHIVYITPSGKHPSAAVEWFGLDGSTTGATMLTDLPRTDSEEEKMQRCHSVQTSENGCRPPHSCPPPIPPGNGLRARQAACSWLFASHSQAAGVAF